MENLCPHRWEVSLNFSVIGFGKDKDEAVEEAFNYAIPNISDIRNWVSINNVEQSWDQDTCDICEEEE